MPCSDDRDQADIDETRSRKLRESERRDSGRASTESALAELRERNNVLAALLCDTCLRLENAGKLDLLGAVTGDWWRAHKAWDQRRKEN